RFEQHQHRLRLRITEAAVKLNHFGAVVGQNKTREKKANKWVSFGTQACKGLLKDVSSDIFQLTFLDERIGTESAHAAGIWSLVAYIGSLVVLGRHHHLEV